MATITTINAAKVQDAFHYALTAAGKDSAFSGEDGKGGYPSCRTGWLKLAVQTAREAGCIVVRAPRRLAEVPALVKSIHEQAAAAGIDAEKGETFEALRAEEERCGARDVEQAKTEETKTKELKTPKTPEPPPDIEMGKCRSCGRSVWRWGLNGYGNCGDCQKKIREAQIARIAREQPEVRIQVGDRIAIARSGRRYTGIVTEANNWGRECGWYIQFTHDERSDGRKGEPGYWKQGEDGGVVELAPMVRRYRVVVQNAMGLTTHESAFETEAQARSYYDSLAIIGSTKSLSSEARELSTFRWSRQPIASETMH